MKQILCYGDSNTWGYDPRDPFSDRYEADALWCAILARETGIPTVNLGENGRCIPDSPRAFEILHRALAECGEKSLILVMLGTNDILRGTSPERAAGKLEALLTAIRRDAPGAQLLLLAPPIPGLPEFSGPMAALADRCAELARRQEIPFFRADSVPLSFDGVHFSEEGHRVFAEKLLQFLVRSRLIP